MVKTEMSIFDMLKQYHYGSIFKLTKVFQDKEGGLQQKHYKYALMENYKIENPEKRGRNQVNYLDCFFLDPNGNNLLEEMYRKGEIKKDCIKPGNTLSNFLKIMVKKGILEISNPGKKRKKYKVPLSIINEITKDDIISILKDEYSGKLMNNFKNIIDFSSIKFISPKINIDGYLFGFPIFSKNNIINFNLTSKEILNFGENLENILKSIIKINELKNKKFCKNKDKECEIAFFIRVTKSLFNLKESS